MINNGYIVFETKDGGVITLSTPDSYISYYWKLVFSILIEDKLTFKELVGVLLNNGFHLGYRYQNEMVEELSALGFKEEKLIGISEMNRYFYVGREVSDDITYSASLMSVNLDSNYIDYLDILDTEWELEEDEFEERMTEIRSYRNSIILMDRSFPATVPDLINIVSTYEEQLDYLVFVDTDNTITTT